MTIARILARAAELIAKPDAWAQNALALDKAGRKVMDTDEAACRFCLNGAIGRAAAEFGAPSWPAMLALDRTLERAKLGTREIARGRIVSFNDAGTTTHAQALDLLKRAAKEQAELEGSQA
jgi:hypothetical protein